MTTNRPDSNEERPESAPWTPGDPIRQQDWESVRELIYAGFTRRQVRQRLKLHERLIGEVFDQLSPPKHPKLSDEMKEHLKEMIADGASLEDIADWYGVSTSSARDYAKVIGVPPRTLTTKYIRENRNKGT